nr:ribonuclease kappa isoform X3 [Saimiri boliviensis boliviensis]
MRNGRGLRNEREGRCLNSTTYPLPLFQIMLGIFFNVHSAVLIEDVPFTEKDFENGPQNIYNLYEQVSYNCFIAAGLYLLLGGFSFCQVRLNKRKEYMVR